MREKTCTERKRERARETKRRNKSASSSSYLLPINPLSNQRPERKRESEKDPGRDGAVGSKLKLLSPAFS